MNLDEIWQVHIWIDRVPDSQGKGRFGGTVKPQQKHTIAKKQPNCQSYAATRSSVSMSQRFCPLPNYFGPC